MNARRLSRLLIVLLLFSPCTFAQKSTSLRDALQKVTKAFGTQFVYDKQLLDGKTTTYSLDNIAKKPVEDVLKGLLYSNNLVFLYVKPNYYSIVPKDRVGTENLSESNQREAIQPTLTSFTASKERIRITGTVTDSSGKGVPNATVTERGFNNSTTTNSNGSFVMNVNGASSVLSISSVGYETKEVTVGAQNNLTVSLATKAAALDEVVVVGYGTVKKSDVTGAVVSLKASELTSGANVNVQQMLQGRASGVQISQKSGEPGSAMSVQIRGVTSITAGNDPLYVIDGMPVNNEPPTSGVGAFFANATPRNPLNSLNPSDIASIEILKDASATAIYGSRGANGVVLITTKSGSSNKLTINFNSYYGFQKVAKKEEDLNAQQYHDIINAIIAEGGGLVADTVTSNFGAGTDWQSQLYQQPAVIQSHDLSVAGGAMNTKYFLSVGYYDQQGILKNSGTRRYTARINLNNTVSKKYSIGINLNTSYIQDKFNSSGLGTNEDGGAVYAAINYDPTSPIYAADGSYYRSPYMNVDNPVALINGETGIGNSYRTFGTMYGEYFITPSLSAKIRLGGDINSSRRNVWVDPITQSAKPYNGVASIIDGTKSYYMAEGTFNYNKTIRIHSVNAVAGVTYEHFGTNAFNGNGRGYALPDLTYNSIGSGDPTANIIGSSFNENIITSYLARVNYSYKDEYLLTASIRTDGSARFGQNNKFGYFPSAALAWKLSKKEFIQNIKVINELKLRVSYGQTGNQAIGNYLYIPTFSTASNAVFGNVVYTSISPTRKSNPDLQWEVAKQLDMGLDFEILKRRLRGSIEYYIRRTSNLLVNLPLPASSGFTGQIQNVGSMKNTGWDITLNADVIKNRSFNWNVNSNFSFYKNKVVSLGSLANIINGGAAINGGLSIIAPGLPLQAYYGYEIIGTWQTKEDFTVTKDKVQPGDVKYRDVNGDSTITDQDRIVLGNPSPDYTFGITNTFAYKGLSLTAYLEGSYGASLLYNSMVDAYFPVSLRRNKLAEPYLNRWTANNPTNDYPSFVHPVAQGQRQVNSKTVLDASYLRLQSLRLAYDIPMKSRKAIKNLSVYVNAQNLFTITDYKGIDPMANSSGNAVQRVDFSSYPFTKTYTFGLSAGF